MTSEKMTPAQTAEEFFGLNYAVLRKREPMRWMRRMFGRLVDERPPQLVDLPTGSGKTDLVVIWLLALAWYAQDRAHRAPVPRRLVWVVNRRVLVRQVFVLAAQLRAKLAAPGAELELLSKSLRNLCRDSTAGFFRIIELRGQLVDDREWSFDPSIPQLIIGTVDQIGSRLLFQGYGLGKWARPLHAALLGVDAWICVDEAHLVPEFALTLRQMRQHASKPVETTVETLLGSVFKKLPFWSTELSATPALPLPEPDAVFQIIDEDRDDVAIADRLLAAESRVIRFSWIFDVKKLADELAKQAIASAKDGAAIAVFCKTVKDAEKVSAILAKKPEFKNRVLTITGRLRGYERDRLVNHPLFSRFRGDRSRADTNEIVAFLVGTAAAEVGLDADTDAIVCDFASMPTLLQRLGRLDRRGILSRRARETGTPFPTMTIVDAKVESSAQASVLQRLQKALQDAEQSAEFLAGNPWRDGATGDGVESTIKAATWKIIEGSSDPLIAAPPGSWLVHNLAAIPFGPVVVPPLTAAVLQQWAATTPNPSRFLPVHPWLYGLLPDGDGTPLVGVAFRVELDLLQHEELDEDADSPGLSPVILETFRRFPPLRSELHFVPFPRMRDWLEFETSREVCAAFFNGDAWALDPTPSSLRPDTVIVLPTSIAAHLLDELLTGNSERDMAQLDVFEPVSSGAARYRRVVKVSGQSRTASLERSEDGAIFVRTVGPDVPEPTTEASQPTDEWKFARPVAGAIQGLNVTIAYYRKVREQSRGQLLSEHHAAAVESAAALSCAIAPGDDFLKHLLVESARVHDRGKEFPKWQRAMGNDDLTRPIAKPIAEQPASTGGFRHEWESLRKMIDAPSCLPGEWTDATRGLWLDLWHHIIGAHHGFFRPSMPDRGFAIPPAPSKQIAARLAAIRRYAALQDALGPWRLAYLESLLKATDVEASRDTLEDAPNET
jgi:CRISPR-associated endonuclease/helicase Cas3